jgi:hypothetical protein
VAAGGVQAAVLGRRGEVNLHPFYPVDHPSLVRHPQQSLGVFPEPLVLPFPLLLS